MHKNPKRPPKRPLWVLRKRFDEIAQPLLALKALMASVSMGPTLNRSPVMSQATEKMVGSMTDQKAVLRGQAVTRYYYY